MRICIPIDVLPQGGMFTFLGNFQSWLQRRGIPFTRSLEDEYDILFVNSWAVPYVEVRRARRQHPNARVVQRVDGAAVDYGSSSDNDRVQARVNLLADLTIFQSIYSRFSTTAKFPVIAQDGPVIYNPVDVGLFRPPEGGSRFGGAVRVAAASWSVNRKKGTWQIGELAEQHPDVEFHLCGRFDDVPALANVKALGHLNRPSMADALRACDVFVNLSENDPCPNVVLEALATGLPVIYKPSGGVPEQVGECGAPLAELSQFGEVLDRVMAGRTTISAAARQRAETQFAPDVIFPQYVEAMSGAVRRAEPSRLHRMALARRGYPVLPAMRTAPQLVRAIARRAPATILGLGSAAARPRVGWVTYDSFPCRKRRFSQLDSFTGMRVGNVARWLNAHDPRLVHELYNPDRRYAIVVFQKMMNATCQAEAVKARSYGTKVVFDANVNYYEVWGDYFVPGTEPTAEQQHDAHWMTRFADHVVADSSYLEGVIRRITPHVTWIADNVDLEVYRGTRRHEPARPVRLVWSGIGKKAAHLLQLADVLGSLRGVELVLVLDETPPWLEQLERALPCRVVSFTHARYAQTLVDCDIIISPKRLVNAYEMGHTEYKITLGMAVGLPAVASPQQSYVEAISHLGGGLVADQPQAWRDALDRLVRDPAMRASMGSRAQQTVRERYATPVVAAKYGHLLATLAGVALERSEATVT